MQRILQASPPHHAAMAMRNNGGWHSVFAVFFATGSLPSICPKILLVGHAQHGKSYFDPCRTKQRRSYLLKDTVPGVSKHNFRTLNSSYLIQGIKLKLQLLQSTYFLKLSLWSSSRTRKSVIASEKESLIHVLCSQQLKISKTVLISLPSRRIF